RPRYQAVLQGMLDANLYVRLSVSTSSYLMRVSTAAAKGRPPYPGAAAVRSHPSIHPPIHPSPELAAARPPWSTDAISQAVSQVVIPGHPPGTVDTPAVLPFDADAPPFPPPGPRPQGVTNA